MHWKTWRSFTFSSRCLTLLKAYGLTLSINNFFNLQIKTTQRPYLPPLISIVRHKALDCTQNLSAAFCNVLFKKSAISYSIHCSTSCHRNINRELSLLHSTISSMCWIHLCNEGRFWHRALLRSLLAGLLQAQKFTIRSTLLCWSARPWFLLRLVVL